VFFAVFHGNLDRVWDVTLDWVRDWSDDRYRVRFGYVDLVRSVDRYLDWFYYWIGYFLFYGHMVRLGYGIGYCAGDDEPSDVLDVFDVVKVVLAVPIIVTCLGYGDDEEDKRRHEQLNLNTKNWH